MTMMHKNLFRAQRYSAMLLAPMVIIHLIVIIIAVRNGLSADEILTRTRSNFAWTVFYFIFVLATSVHAPIGIRNVLQEWTSLSQSVINAVSLLLLVLFLFTGIRAVIAIS